MEPNLIVLVFSAVVIAAYVFDVLCRKIKLPSVIVLLLSGIAARRHQVNAHQRTHAGDFGHSGTATVASTLRS